jgi:formylglycine-generating enzyme required for sulfatase activity
LAASRTIAVATTEQGAGVTAEEAASYAQAVAEALGQLPDLKILEREKLKAVLDERDIALAFGPEAADSRYAASAKSLAADEVVVPTMSKIENDYLLCLRLVSVVSGATRSCTVHRTRLVAKFPEHAKRQVQELFEEQITAVPPDDEQAPVSLETLRQSCLAAAKLFPALWKRCEDLRENPNATTPAQLAHYYIALTILCGRASSPPAGMVFVPGGYVMVNTSAGERRLWVEPFFMDRCETTVAQYNAFLQASSARDAGAGRKFQSITRGYPEMIAPGLPISGITYEAAAAYAQAEGKALPTMLQWLRAACGDDGRKYPCGGEEQLSACRLKRGKSSENPLTPAEAAKSTTMVMALVTAADQAAGAGDESPFGVIFMTSNVREWTCTWYDANAYASTPADRPEEPADGTLKIVKGGSWRTEPSQATCAAYDKFKPTEAFDDVGFRCVVPFFLGNAPADRPVMVVK